jgi:alginate O-acetyltransferase complex protein AlgI
MSSWFRDYLYATVRGDNRSFPHMLKTQMITMTVIGLWHGASWTFVVWGAYNGVVMVVETVLKRFFGGYSLWDTIPARVFFTLLTFSLFTFSGIMFRSDSFGKAWDMMKSFAVTPEVNFYPDKFDSAVVLGVVAGVLVFHQYIRTKRLDERARELPMLVRGGVIATMVLAIALVRGETNAFIYFQF